MFASTHGRVWKEVNFLTNLAVQKADRVCHGVFSSLLHYLSPISNSLCNGLCALLHVHIENTEFKCFKENFKNGRDLGIVLSKNPI